MEVFFKPCFLVSSLVDERYFTTYTQVRYGPSFDYGNMFFFFELKGGNLDRVCLHIPFFFSFLPFLFRECVLWLRRMQK